MMQNEGRKEYENWAHEHHWLKRDYDRVVRHWGDVHESEGFKYWRDAFRQAEVAMKWRCDSDVTERDKFGRYESLGFLRIRIIRRRISKRRAALRALWGLMPS